MRLLHAETLQLKEFMGGNIPPYAILSHTWGEDEVLFGDVGTANASKKTGYAKILFGCTEALKNGLQYIWVDTCCIDKSSSAELSESINSMFMWYKMANVCYAYMEDVPSIGDGQFSKRTFAQSRWFTRGWTLQELLAPSVLYFFTAEWDNMGSKQRLASQISTITGISQGFLVGRALSKASIAKRMSWASRRKTTRAEDTAYCLLGIFDINMPLLYGEGDKAFLRLQDEIMKTSLDESLFAWGYDSGVKFVPTGLLATNPAAFENSGDIIPDEIAEPREPYVMTKKGLRMHLPVIYHSENDLPFAIIACRREEELQVVLGVSVYPVRQDQYHRLDNRVPVAFSRDHIGYTPCQTLYIQRFVSKESQDSLSNIKAIESPCPLLIRKISPSNTRYRIASVDCDSWNSSDRIIRRKRGTVIIRFESDGLEQFEIEISHRKGGMRRSFNQSKVYNVKDGSRDEEINDVKVSIVKPRRLLSGLVVSLVDIELQDTKLRNSMDNKGKHVVMEAI
jgi:hypothetical protein